MRHLERFVWAVWLGGVALGCPESSMPPFVGSDAGRDAPDAPVCDRDGDGADGPQCGGPDCDDDEPLLSDTRSFCVDAQTQRRCTPTIAIDAPCPGVCDARTGTCTAEACGDGVVHEGEACDDGNDVVGDACDPDCVPRETCESSRDCPGARPLCSGQRDDGSFYCLARIASAALGSPCSVDDDCESSLCDPRQRRCTVACSEHGDCEFMGQQHWCGRGVRDPMRYEGSDLAPPVCHRGCRTSQDCPSTLICRVLVGGATPPTVFTQCDMPQGSRPIGGSCNGGDTFACEENCHLPSLTCTELCENDESCPDTAPCRSLFLLYGTFPVFWGWAAPTWCDFSI